jgi:hypothetical protein
LPVECQRKELGAIEHTSRLAPGTSAQLKDRSALATCIEAKGAAISQPDQPVVIRGDRGRCHQTPAGLSKPASMTATGLAPGSNSPPGPGRGRPLDTRQSPPRPASAPHHPAAHRRAAASAGDRAVCVVTPTTEGQCRNRKITKPALRGARDSRASDAKTRTDFVRRLTLQLNALHRERLVEKIGRGRGVAPRAAFGILGAKRNPGRFRTPPPRNRRMRDASWAAARRGRQAYRSVRLPGAVANRALELLGKELGMFISRQDP